MQIGIIGLGRMGGNIARRLMRHHHDCVVYDTNTDARSALAAEGAQAADSLTALRDALQAPRTVWVMLPAGEPTASTLAELAPLLDDGDTVIDGGNSYFRDDIRHAEQLGEHGIGFIDVGTSGGVWGLEEGYCMMIGGEAERVRRLDPIFRALAPGRGDVPSTPGREDRDERVELGYMHTGPVGSGHFVKMVHNGIEYGLMQAYAEGFDILRNRNAEHLPEASRFDLDLADVAEVWRRGSVVRSWLLDLTAGALAETPTLDGYSGYVNDSGEGRWTLEAAIEEAVPAEVISSALFARFRSRREHTFAERVLSAMRHAFGGHVEEKGKR